MWQELDRKIKGGELDKKTISSSRLTTKFSISDAEKEAYAGGLVPGTSGYNGWISRSFEKGPPQNPHHKKK